MFGTSKVYIAWISLTIILKDICFQQFLPTQVTIIAWCQKHLPLPGNRATMPPPTLIEVFGRFPAAYSEHPPLLFLHAKGHRCGSQACFSSPWPIREGVLQAWSSYRVSQGAAFLVFLVQFYSRQQPRLSRHGSVCMCPEYCVLESLKHPCVRYLPVTATAHLGAK